MVSPLIFVLSREDNPTENRSRRGDLDFSASSGDEVLVMSLTLAMASDKKSPSGTIVTGQGLNLSHCLGEWSTFLGSATLQRTQTWASHSNSAFFLKKKLTAKFFIHRGERDL